MRFNARPGVIRKKLVSSALVVPDRDGMRFVNCSRILANVGSSLCYIASCGVT